MRQNLKTKYRLLFLFSLKKMLKTSVAHLNNRNEEIEHVMIRRNL